MVHSALILHHIGYLSCGIPLETHLDAVNIVIRHDCVGESHITRVARAGLTANPSAALLKDLRDH